MKFKVKKGKFLEAIAKNGYYLHDACGVIPNEIELEGEPIKGWCQCGEPQDSDMIVHSKEKCYLKPSFYPLSGLCEKGECNCVSGTCSKMVDRPKKIEELCHCGNMDCKRNHNVPNKINELIKAHNDKL